MWDAVPAHLVVRSPSTLSPAAAHPPFVGSCFEESICLLQRTGKQLKLDIATIHVGKPCLIAEGHPDLESTKDFPLALMERGFSIDIAKAEATQEEDRLRILNSVAGKEEAELDTEPPTEHEKFTQVRQKRTGPLCKRMGVSPKHVNACR